VIQSAATAVESDIELVDALRRGDEGAFVQLVDRYQAPMLRLSMTLVRSQAIAEEVVQEAWLGVLQGLDRFEGRASLKTWIYRIVINIGIRKAERERRSVPFSYLQVDAGPAVDPARFRTPPGRSSGHWAFEPRDWSAIPEDRLLSRETLRRVATAIRALSPNQRAVVTLHDVEGLSSAEVCDVLSISETNQRVLLHRARSRVRAALERYLETEP
jgi:RNA polymerase sigma-70 factor (ECF subfamily)